MTLNLPELEAGDVVFFADESWVSRVIRWFTRHGGESETIYSHCGQMINPYLVGQQNIKVSLDQIGEVIRGRSKRTRMEIWRYDLTLGQQSKIHDYWMNAEGAPYGALKIIAHMLDGLLGKFGRKERVFFRRLFITPWHTCSGRVGLAMSEAFSRPSPFAMLAGRESPDDIHDFVLASDRWKKVWDSGAIER
jgi:hypothetical protein